jgi:hypothetical protein
VQRSGRIQGDRDLPGFPDTEQRGDRQRSLLEENHDGRSSGLVLGQNRVRDPVGLPVQLVVGPLMRGRLDREPLRMETRPALEARRNRLLDFRARKQLEGCWLGSRHQSPTGEIFAIRGVFGADNASSPKGR